MSRRLLVTASALVTALAVLSGCATIPTTSAVVQGPDIQSQLTNDYLYYSPAGPVKDESAADILAGFLNASTGPQNDYGVARQYLAADFRTKWSPNQKVYIQRGVQKTKIRSDGSATVSMGVSAEVDSQGHYTIAATGANVELHFKMVQSKGQWRIAEAPNAVVMIRPVFEVIFHSYQLYFFDHSYRYLIPDLRWFPARASTATRLVSALLYGPSPWLAPAVGSVLPTSTKLAIDAVTVDKGKALVNLAQSTLKASRLDRQRFKAELVATLTQLTGISSVEIQIDSIPQKVDAYSVASTASTAYAPVVLSGNSLQQLIGPSGSRLGNADSWVTSIGAYDFAVTADETGLALVGKKGVYTARLDQTGVPPRLVDSRKSLLSPRYDSRGQLWLLGADGRIQVVPRGKTSTWLSIEWAKTRQVQAFAISPEGSRLAVLIADSDGTQRLMAAAIIRDSAGQPTGIGSPVELNFGVGTPRAIEWAGESGVMVLSDVSAAASNLSQLNIGGDPREVGTLNHAVNLMSSSDGTNVYVVDDFGGLMEYRGYTWTQLDQGVVAAHMAN